MHLRAVLCKAFPRTLPVLAGYIFLGIAYGIAMNVHGFSPVWSLSSSLLIYAGSMQFALIETLEQSFAPLTITLLAVLINARHLFYSLSMLSEYESTGRFKPYLVFALTDETFSLVCHGAPQGVDRGRWFMAVSALDQLYWFTGTLLGALIGALIPIGALTGIDFSMTALFTVIVTEQSLHSLREVRAGHITRGEALFAPLLGGLATLFSLLTVGRKQFLLLSMGLILTVFLGRYAAARKRGEAL